MCLYKRNMIYEYNSEKSYYIPLTFWPTGKPNIGQMFLSEL